MPPSFTKIIIVAGSVIAFAPAHAQSFEKQLTAGKAAAEKPEGQRYEQELAPAIGQAMRTCIPPGTTGPSTLGNFTLVASVTLNGSLRGALVEPQSKVALCFSRELAALRLPPPPYVNASASGTSYPIAVEMKVTP